MKKLKNLTVLFALLTLALSLAGCNIHFHDWSSATCTAPAQCECGESSGEPLGHKYADATCTAPQICERCGDYNGKSLGHTYTGSISCTEEQVCSRCGTSSGSVLGHDYVNATCTTPKTCQRCSVTIGAELGHNYSSATCTSPQICLRCEETKGAPLGHNYADATCESPQICTQCGNSNGNPLGHHYADNVCIRCQQVDPESLPVGLDKVHVIDQGYYSYSKDQYTDSYGYTYNGAHIYRENNNFTICHLYSIHNLNKDYKLFSGSFVAGNNMYKTATIEIYVDDILKYSVSDYTRTSSKVDFEIDVSNAHKLHIKISIPYMYGKKDSEIALVNAELTK